jgi:glycosyltransferase involved in cell wall biosynthesis
VIGTRGYPSYYGGFETAVRKLAPYLADKGWDVTVYCRHGATRLDDPETDLRVATRLTRGLETKSLSTLSYGLTSSLDATLKHHDVALVFNVGNGYFLPFLKARGIPTLVNVDGIEWERAKWNPLAKFVFRTGAEFTARFADRLLFDARAIETYWQQKWGLGGVFVPYGSEVPPLLPIPEGLEHRGYVLSVGRLVPENSVPEFFAAIPKIAAKHPVVIVGSSGYADEWDAAARQLAEDHPSVRWTGHINEYSKLLALWQHAGVYFHGHTVGGTNPTLVQAMASGAPILARDTIYSREVLGSAGKFVPADPDEIAETILTMMANPDALDEACRANVQRAIEHYSWDQVNHDYEQALRELATKERKGAGKRLIASAGAQFKKLVRKAVLAYSVRNRHRKADQILAFLAEQNAKDVLLVGTMGDEHAGNSGMVNAGIVEKRLAANYEVKMSINIEPAITAYPFMIADARDMPFDDDYVDFALANAIIEHVGQEAEQRKMVEEMTRVARTWVITTPNKWFPIESHTSAIFLHWFPAWSKKHEADFTRLLSRRQFRKLLPPGAELSGAPWSPTFTARFSRR